MLPQNPQTDEDIEHFLLVDPKITNRELKKLAEKHPAPKAWWNDPKDNPDWED